jgi:branched-chain amino acid transport system substrate-binding protein
MKKYIMLTLVVVALAGTYALSQGGTNTLPAEQEPIKIATILSETGIAAAFGENAKLGALLAVEEINTAGGIDGRRIELITEDDQTDPKMAVGLYKKVTAIDRVDAIIGSNFDFIVNPLFAEAQKGDTVVITPTSPRIAGAVDTNDHSFTMLSDFSEIVFALRGYLTETPYEKMAVIHYNSAFGSEIVRTINIINAEQGKPAVIDETYNEFGLGDWTPYILKMKKEGVDLVFADMLGTDYLKFATQAKQLGFEAELITSMDVREGLRDTSADLSALENTVVLNWDVLGNDEIFKNKFIEKYNRESDHFAAQAYVAVYVLAEAVQGSETTADRQRILETKMFTTPIGSFSFTKDHTQAKTDVAIEIIKNGKLVPLQ